MATASLTSVPLKDRIHRSQHRHPLLHAESMGRLPTYKNYDEVRINKAYTAVKSGMSIRKAAEEYGVPRSTLSDRASGKVQAGAKSGPRKYLNTTEEVELANFLSGCSSIGYSRTRKQIIDIVQEVVNKKGIGVTVSISWWKSFVRHLVVQEPESLSHSRVVGRDNAALEKYFDLLERTILEADLSERPCQIFNLDESGFPLCPKPPKVSTKKGEKHPACVTGEDRSQTTVLACVSAGGYALPPLVILILIERHLSQT